MGTGSTASLAARARSAGRHPVALVALAGVPVALQHAWVVAHRPLGTLDLDEAGYLAAALRISRNLRTDGIRAAHDVLPTQSGPLVPLLSQPALLVHPRSPVAALLVVAVLHVLVAVGVAGAVRRLGGDGRAVVAGLVALALPGLAVQARAYGFGVPAAAFAALALWALLASERGHRLGPLVGFGAALGALVITRTMTIALLPGFAVAAAWELRCDRRTARNLVPAGLVGVSVAGWWWGPNGADAWGYLRRSGYGSVADAFGPGSVVGRIDAHVWVAARTIRLPLLVVGLAAVVAVVVGVRAGGPIGPRLRPWWRGDAGRPLVAVALFVVLGWLALLTSANNTDPFDLPVLVGALVAVAGATRWAAPAWRRPLAVATLVVAVLDLVLLGPAGAGLEPPAGSPREGLGSFRPFGGVDSEGTWPTFVDAQRSAGPGAGPAATDPDAWWRASVLVARALGRVEVASPTGSSRAVVGSTGGISANSVLLAEEVDDLPHAPLVEVDANRPVADLASVAEELAAGRPQAVLVLLEPRVGLAGAPDQPVQVAALRRRLEREGWRVTALVRLPDGGAARLLQRR